MKEHGKLELERMAKETGGLSYGVTKNQPIEATYSQIEQTLRNQYSIGYAPSRSSPDGKFHKLKLMTRDPSNRHNPGGLLCQMTAVDDAAEHALV
jgi:hypothetical protein